MERAALDHEGLVVDRDRYLWISLDWGKLGYLFTFFHFIFFHFISLTLYFSYLHLRVRTPSVPPGSIFCCSVTHCDT